LEWSEAGVEGAYRFLRRLWQLVVEHAAGGSAPRLHAETLDADQRALRRKLHETIGKVSDDFERRFTFNTAIAAVMELVNAASRSDDRSDQGRALRHEILEAMVLMLSPIVPHLCHALWQELGHEAPVVDVAWPRPDPAALERDVMELVVQVNGKLRAHITLPIDADQAAIEATALADENVRRFTGGRAIRRVIHVPRKLVNIVL
jgi:leucyl-tRNA synthetase